MERKNRITEFKESTDNKAVALAFVYLLIFVLIAFILSRSIFGNLGNDIHKIVQEGGPSYEMMTEDRTNG